MITVEETSAVPPFEQIRAQLSDQILSGLIEAGQRLPSIRQLAADLRVATGTVARAYSELENAGLIASSRATGARVCAGHSFPESVQHAASLFAQAAQSSSLSLEEALSAIRASWRLD